MSNLKRKRLELGMSQKSLATLAGVTRQSISWLELGEVKGSVGLWDRLEDILGEPQRWLRSGIISTRQKNRRGRPTKEPD
ncbi:MAG: helix-turn-helix transcriptional regulator [Deltaproteobacteria bacterium]|nr:helix-turn-helix transcriptional regulator [Deltaproteobacteria bacterium]